MDYKILIMLLALLFLMILLYKEMSSIKEDIIGHVGRLVSNMKSQNDKQVLQLKSNLNQCVGQIKGISTDNLQQLRKITLLNNQPITRTANHFTEVDDSDMRTDGNMLSDRMTDHVSANVKSNNKNVFQESRQSHYYMSEETDRSSMISENAERSTEKPKKKTTIVCEGDVCRIVPTEEVVKKESEKELELEKVKDTVEVKDIVKVEKDIPIYDQTVETTVETLEDDVPLYNENLENSYIETYNGDASEEENESDIPSYQPTTDKEGTDIELDIVNIINNSRIFPTVPKEVLTKINQDHKISENINTDDIYVEQNEHEIEDDIPPNVIKTDLTKSTHSMMGENRRQSVVIEQSSDENLEMNDRTENKPAEEDSETPDVPETDDDADIDASDESITIDVNKIIHTPLPKKALIIDTIQDPESSNCSENEDNHETPKIESISIYSTKSKKKPKKDGELDTISHYSINELKKLSKDNNLPITYKDGKKTKFYKKDELYKNLKEKLTDNNK